MIHSNGDWVGGGGFFSSGVGFCGACLTKVMEGYFGDGEDS